MRMRTLGVVAALALVAGGCGASDEDQAKEALAASIMEESSSTLTVSQSEADCIAAGFVDDIGVDQLKDYGILSEDETNPATLDEVTMSEGDAESAADAFVDCVDVQQMLTDELPLDGMDAEVVECVKGALSEDVIHDILAATFRGDSPDSASPEVADQLSACITG